jgi:uncharacterized damage-inducible protein DinB
MEPWLAGRFAELAPIPRLLCCSLEQSLDDVRKWTEPLTDEQIWARPVEGDKGSVGFHLRHLAGSVDRLLTYARGEALREEQLAFLRAESEPGAGKAELLAQLASSYAAAAAFAETADEFDAPRFIGRQRLQTPLGVLLAHIAEHTQRHTGQLIVLAKFAYRSYK